MLRGFPPMPDWFHDNRDFGKIAERAARRRGWIAADVDGVMGGNWLRFFEKSFGAQPTARLTRDRARAE